MAPRDRRNSDPRLTLIRSAASDILQGQFDVGVGPLEASQPQPQPSPANGPADDDSAKMKSKIRRQLAQLDNDGAAKEDAVKDLTESVDMFMRKKDLLSETESISDPLEFDFRTPDGKRRQTRVPRTGRVADIKTAIKTETNQTADLLLRGASLSDDNLPVYKAWTQLGLAKRGVDNNYLQMAPRCGSG